MRGGQQASLMSLPASLMSSYSQKLGRSQTAPSALSPAERQREQLKMKRAEVLACAAAERTNLILLSRKQQACTPQKRLLHTSAEFRHQVAERDRLEETRRMQVALEREERVQSLLSRMGGPQLLQYQVQVL